MKKCTTCKTEKPLEDFYKDKNQKDGREIYCKECRKRARIVNYDIRQQYYLNNKDSILQKKKQDYIKNKKAYLDKNKKYYNNNTNTIHNWYQEYRLKRFFNITLDEYNSILQKQNMVCAICKQPETSKYKTGTVKKLSVDHDHNTGKIRGLLCNKCNRGLGYFKDNIDIFKNIILYLENNTEKS